MKTQFLQAYGPLLLAILIGATLGAALGYYGQCTTGTCPLTSTWWRGALYGGIIGLLFGASSYSKRNLRELTERPDGWKTERSQVPETQKHPDPEK